MMIKPISRDAIPLALEKAERYRLLNEPAQAESICRDVLAADPQNQEALVTLVLALSDQLEERMTNAHDEALALLRGLADEYKRHYYAGILAERRAKAQGKRGAMRGGHVIYESLRQAMAHYERAAELRPPGNDDALLRWNACARFLNEHPELQPDSDEGFRPWLE